MTRMILLKRVIIAGCSRSQGKKGDDVLCPMVKAVSVGFVEAGHLRMASETLKVLGTRTSLLEGSA